MRHIKTRVNSGSSFGVSTNPSRKAKNSTRVSARTYVSNRKVWVCNDCLKFTDYGIGKVLKDLFLLVLTLIVVAGAYFAAVWFLVK
jgi:hypothetical protein